MSIWGKIVGGAAGFLVGGPIGAFLGAMAGHAVDRMRSETDEDGTNSTKQITFTIGVIVLGAKMAKADGVVTKDEVVALAGIKEVAFNAVLVQVTRHVARRTRTIKLDITDDLTIFAANDDVATGLIV